VRHVWKLNVIGIGSRVFSAQTITSSIRNQSISQQNQCSSTVTAGAKKPLAACWLAVKWHTVICNFNAYPSWSQFWVSGTEFISEEKLSNALKPGDNFCQQNKRKPLESVGGIVGLGLKQRWALRSLAGYSWCFWVDIWQIRNANTSNMKWPIERFELRLTSKQYFLSADGRPTAASQALMLGAGYAGFFQRMLRLE